MGVREGVNWRVVGVATVVEAVLVSAAIHTGASTMADGAWNPFAVLGVVGLVAGGLLAGGLAGNRMTTAVRQGVYTGFGAAAPLYVLFIGYLPAEAGGLPAVSGIVGMGLVVVSLVLMVNAVVAMVGSWLKVEWAGPGAYGL